MSALKGHCHALFNVFRQKSKLVLLAHRYKIPGNPLRRNEMHLWHKELFVINFWRLSEDIVCKLEKTGQFFQGSIHFHPLHPWRIDRFHVTSSFSRIQN